MSRAAAKGQITLTLSDDMPRSIWLRAPIEMPALAASSESAIPRSRRRARKRRPTRRSASLTSLAAPSAGAASVSRLSVLIGFASSVMANAQPPALTFSNILARSSFCFMGPVKTVDFSMTSGSDGSWTCSSVAGSTASKAVFVELP